MPTPSIYAGFWRRKAAYGIDSLLVIAITILTAMLFYNPAQAQGNPTIEGLQAAGFLSEDTAALLSLLPTTSADDTPISLPSADVILRILVLTIVFSSIYNIAFVASRWQATPGKYWLGMRVLCTDGRQVSIFRSAARHAATGITMGILSGLGYLTMAFSKEKAALHDLICGTRVVRV
jgi:uncharacterized RDD family membrane protein YckC